jgi:hypothetical protein
MAVKPAGFKAPITGEVMYDSIKKDPFQSLPHEIMLKIFAYSGQYGVERNLQVSKKWRLLTKSLAL